MHIYRKFISNALYKEIKFNAFYRKFISNALYKEIKFNAFYRKFISNAHLQGNQV